MRLEASIATKTVFFLLMMNFDSESTEDDSWLEDDLGDSDDELELDWRWSSCVHIFILT